MSKRRNLFKDVRTDSEQIRESLFKEAYKIPSHGSCPKRDHKNNDHNPWCLDGLGQEVWFNEDLVLDSEEEHFSVRPKYLNKYSGLRNLGATCYVNSLVQILSYNQRFKRSLFQYTPPDTDTGLIIRTLQKLLVDLAHSDRGVLDTSGLITALQLPTTEQQDVVEFGELLFGLLNNSVPDIQNSNKGVGNYVTRCLTCHNTTSRPSHFTDLKLQVQPKNRGLSERIEQLSAVEVLEGDNSYHCGVCGCLRRVERCYKIRSLPQTLHLQLLRFNYNVLTMQRTKDTAYVKFNEVVVLSGDGGDQGDSGDSGDAGDGDGGGGAGGGDSGDGGGGAGGGDSGDSGNGNSGGSGGDGNAGVVTYKLTGIIVHVGETTQSGHYIAIVRQGDKWVTFNDDAVVECGSLDLKQYDLSSARRPVCGAGEHCSQSVYMLVYEDVTSPASPVTSSGSVAAPEDLLSETRADNEDFVQLRELLSEQNADLKSNKQQKIIQMRDLCCRIRPDNSTDFVPLPTDVLKSWFKTGTLQKLSNNSSDPSSSSDPSTTSDLPSLSSLMRESETLTKLLCPHQKLPYHNLKSIKYIHKDILDNIVCFDPAPGPPDPDLAILAPPLSRSNLALCRECVVCDLSQHLYDVELDDDFKWMVASQGAGEGTEGWWVCKEDFRGFKKIVRQGKRFNGDVLCRHESLHPDSKKRKLVSDEVQNVVHKYFEEFPHPSHASVPCTICSDECDTEKIYFTSLLLLRKELQRLITDTTFPYVSGLTPFVVPISFIKYDLQPLYRKKVQERITLDNTVLLCKHDLLASDAPEHAAFLKESEWEILSTHFGPTAPITLVTSSEGGTSVYEPGLCTECVMLHDVYIDQVVYLREDKVAGKRGRRGDKILHLSSYDTVRDVKVLICKKMAISPSEQTLRMQNGRLLEEGTMRELGIVPGSVIYLEYNQVLIQEAEIFERAQEQGFKGTVLSGI